MLSDGCVAKCKKSKTWPGMAKFFEKKIKKGKNFLSVAKRLMMELN